MNAKVIFGMVGALAFIIVYVFFIDTGTSSEQIQTVAMAPNRIGSITKKADLKEVKDVSKTAIYTQEQEELAEQRQKNNYSEQEQDPLSLTKAVSNAYKTSEEKKSEELRKKDLTPSYGGNAFSKIEEKEETHSEPPVNNSEKKKVYSASVSSYSKSSAPTNRKSEVSKQSEPSESTDNVFNTTKFNQSKVQSVTSDGDVNGSSSSSMVKAIVMGQHNVKSGGLIRFRLLEQAVFNGKLFPRNTIFHGKASFGQDRLLVTVDRLPVGNSFVNVPLILHDQDLQEGIYAPVREAKEAASDETMDGVSDLLTSSGTVAGQVGGGVARVFRTATNGTQKVTVADGYPVLFLISEN